MAEVRTESGDAGEVEPGRRRRLRRILTWVAIAILIIVAAALVFAWMERRPIARHLIDNQLRNKGVQGTYTLDRVGLRTQQVSNLRIGDPNHPDVTAKNVLIQLRLQWNGSIDVYRIVARGVRLRGKVLPTGKVTWGQIDKLLPPPSGKPFSLPNVSLDIADSSIALSTPWGPLGFAIQGSGNLSGGFKGHFVSSSPQLITKKCVATTVRGAAAIEIKARHPHVDGPLTAAYFACPDSRFSVVQPRLELDSRFSEGFNRFDAKARIVSQVITAGDNGLAALNGTISFAGTPQKAKGGVDLTARKSRLGTISAERTRVIAAYQLDTEHGTLIAKGNYDADSASLAPSMIAGFTNALGATKGTPIGPVAEKMADSLSSTASNFDVNGGLILANFPGGGGARIVNADLRTPAGGRASISGGKGVTYYWPSGVLRVDGTIRMAGGGLPTGVLELHQQKNGGLNGSGHFEPYVVDGSKLTLSSLRFNADSSGATHFAALTTLDGNFPRGRVSGLTLPINGTVGAHGGIRVGERCMNVSFNSLQMQQVHVGPTKLPICPTDSAVIVQPPGGALRVAGRISRPSLAGSIGESPLRLNAASILFSQKAFTGNSVALRLGKAESPVAVNAAILRGSFTSGGATGTISNGDAVIGTVPLNLTQIDGRWHFAGGNLAIDGSLLLSDRADPPRFYPLQSNDVHFVMADNRITATGTLHHPATGTKVTDVSIEHNLSSGDGHATLDVPGLAFGPNFQPDDLTPLTEGVVALVNGTVTGQGRIAWAGSGAVSSTGDFATRNMDLAAPFGPVTGLTTSMHFTDLLGLETAPHQVATMETVNPGIEVTDGVIRYQILPDELVKIEGGEWPFMGGKLVLDETILNFGKPSAKRLTFELVGFDAQQFIDSLGFKGLEITGKFDGVLPLIFDESGGRLVGGRLESRPPGGEFRYTGTKPGGLVAGTMVELVSDLRYKNMVVRLDGDLAGEFATRLTIDQVSVGKTHGFLAGLVRSAFSKIPLKLNVTINGPFRALIQMGKGFKDPTQTIAPVMPFPIDSPALKVDVLSTTKQEEPAKNPPATAPPAPQSPPGAQK